MIVDRELIRDMVVLQKTATGRTVYLRYFEIAFTGRSNAMWTDDPTDAIKFSAVEVVGMVVLVRYRMHLEVEMGKVGG